MIHIATHLLGLVALTALLWCPGRILAAEVKSHRLGSFWMPRIAELCLGIAIWVLITTILAAFGLLKLSIAGFAALFFFAVVVVRDRRRLPASSSEFYAPLWVPLLLFSLLAPLFLLAISPPVSWDANVYHLTLPKLFVEAGGFRPVDMNVYSNWPLAIEMIYSLALLASDYMLAKAAHFGFGLALLAVLFASCEGRESATARGRDGRRWHAATLGFLLFLCNGVVLNEMRVAYVDLAFAFFFTAAFLFLEQVERFPRPALLLGGVCCGLLAATKITAVIAIAVLCLTFASVLRTSPKRTLTYFVPPILILWAPWPLRSWALTGNPFYPFLHRWFGGPDWSSGLGDALATWQRSIGMGREPVDYLLLPLRVFFDSGTGYQRFDGEFGWQWPLLFALLLIRLVRVPWRGRNLWRPLLAAALYFGAWAATSQQSRFLLPMLALVSLSVARETAAWLAEKRSSLRLWIVRSGIAAVTVALLVHHGRVLSAGYSTLRLYGQLDRTQLAGTAVDPIYDRVAELPPDAKLLLLDTNHGFHLQREYLADSFFEASQISSWLGSARSDRDVVARLRERRITHILRRRLDPGVPYPVPILDLLANESLVELLVGGENGEEWRWKLFALR